MALAVKAGSEIKYQCPLCDLELWHTVVAIVGKQPARIRCNTCKSERNYKAPKLESSSRSSKLQGSHPDFYQQKLRENVMKTVKSYRADSEFAAEDVVDHIKFGRGIVLKLVHPDRINVLFQDEMRTLVRKPTAP